MSQYRQDIEQIARMLDKGMTFENPEVAIKVKGAAENHEKSEEEIRGAAHHQWGRWITSREAGERRQVSAWLKRMFAKKNSDGSFKYRRKGQSWASWYEDYQAGKIDIDEEDIL